jgi:hypothetical protein
VTPRRWTADEERLLREIHAKGWSIATAMAELGRTQAAIQARSWNMGLRWGRAPRLGQVGTLADEIEAARREMASAPLFRPGSRV